MQYLTDDVRISGMEEAAAPERLIEEMPISRAASQLVFNLRRRLSDIIAGRDDRVAVVVGPCSIHDPHAAMEYAERLTEQADRLEEDLCVIMRVYFEKPRTTVGWKGLINDPHLDGTFDINLGLRTARRLLHDIVDLGLGTGTEYLDPISPQYYGDLVCWGAIGARTTESQVHRQLASGLSCPVGFKNSTNGNIQVAADAVKSAKHEHVFLSVTKAGHSAIFQTTGNDDCHIILRGGGGETNYDNPSVHYASKILEQAGMRDGVMIDMSHANAQRDPQRQINVCDDICSQLEAGEEHILGVMIESNLVGGSQSIDADELVYGQSVTDACVGWDDTVACLDKLAIATRRRREAS